MKKMFSKKNTTKKNENNEIEVKTQSGILSFAKKIAPAPPIQNEIHLGHDFLLENFDDDNDPYQTKLVGKTIANSKSEKKIDNRILESAESVGLTVNSNRSKASKSTNAGNYGQVSRCNNVDLYEDHQAPGGMLSAVASSVFAAEGGSRSQLQYHNSNGIEASLDDATSDQTRNRPLLGDNPTRSNARD